MATNWADYFQNRFSGVSALVTGGAGFIGSHLTDALLTLGARVTILDDMTGGLESNLQFLAQNHPGKLTIVKGSILDEDALARATQGAKYVFHQAAMGSVPRSMKEPELYMQNNILGTLKTLQAAKAAGVKRVMFAASSSAYGDTPTLPKVETMPVLPKSPYAVTKVAGEGLMRTFALSYGLDTVSLRYFNIFGPRQNANSAYAAVIAAFAKALAEGKSPVIFGDGTQSRDFTFVDNAVYANLLGADTQTPLQGQVINVAAGSQVDLNQLAREMISFYGQNSSPVHAADRAGDVKHSLADLKLAATLLGYSPIVGFQQGLRQTVDWYRQASR